MASAAPPSEYFSGIDFNISFYTEGDSSVSLNYVNSNFLKCVGYAYSRAISTSFNGVKVIRSLFIVPVAILASSRSGIFTAVKEIRSLFIVPDVILDAFKFVNSAPEPLNKLSVIVPFAVMSVV